MKSFWIKGPGRWVEIWYIFEPLVLELAIWNLQSCKNKFKLSYKLKTNNFIFPHLEYNTPNAKSSFNLAVFFL